MVLNKIKLHTNNDITFRLASRLFRGMLEAKYSLLTEHSITEMVTIINSHTVNGMICLDSWVIILNEVSFLALVLAVFIFINPLTALIVIAVFAAISLLLYLGIIKKIPALGYEQTALCIQVYKVSTAAANSIKDIKIMGLGNNYFNKFSQTWYAYSRNYTNYFTLKNIPRDFSETLVFSGIITVCLYVLLTHQNVTSMIPTLGVLALTTMRILPSFNRIIGSYNDYKFYRTSLKDRKSVV